VTGRGRAEAMGRRISRTAGRLGVDSAGLDFLRRAFEIGMAPRFDRAFDDHHPDYLHPARTALILMDDARIDDTVTLATALVTETRDPTLRPEPRALVEIPRVADLLAGVPDPAADETLAEALLGAPRGACMVALAERLDHARHLHLRERPEWGPYHELTRRIYAPIADRTHPTLGGRLAWWCATFEERFLAP
jgi:hypothetical protein